eukprot:Gregarina_sp_Pseudo_9__1015@NODE_1656_length_1420_cov_374_650253_g1536_i0_p3_GENE_NODE_1656_length_1420_cov_374_650253_g1536_i0NODE_1656_length_1420_cov_374_650253_g1536_i0_p3_ORF_typecomplete_len154_score41_04PI_PP_I/PF18363_1/0_27_NODE_1656_length_1420_cov_374_650253_g1536_i08021263
MVDFGAIFDKVRGKEHETEPEKSAVPSYILPFLPPWFQELSPSQQTLVWNLAKGLLASGGTGESAGSGLDFGSILGGVMGFGGSHENNPVASRSRGFTAAPGDTPHHEQQGWAAVVAAAHAEEGGDIDMNQWPFNDPVHGDECRAIASRVKGQ